MATLNFYLKEPNSKGLCPIQMCYQVQGKKFRISPQILIHPDLWDGRRIKGKTLIVLEMNNTLNEYENTIREIELEAVRLKKNYPIEVIEQKFRFKINSVNNDNSDFNELFGYFLESSKATKSENTIKSYEGLKYRLDKFSIEKGIRLKFEDINQTFYEKFISYLITEKKLLNNTVGKHVKVLKVFLNFVMSNELIPTKINLKKFKVYKEDIDIVALTEDELWKIYNCQNLPLHLEHVKDFFCFECFTGLRYSDVAKITNDNIKGDFIEIRTKKTRDVLSVPLNNFAWEIINKYRGRYDNSPLPPAISNQKTNEYIKEVAELALVDDITLIEKFSGARRLEIRKPKYDLISTHTGRKTFITLSFERGMPAEMIMKITGIKKWETLKKYLKVSEKSKLLQMNTFWNKKSLYTN